MFEGALVFRSSGMEQIVICSLLAVIILLSLLVNRRSRSLVQLLSLLFKFGSLAILGLLLMKPERREKLLLDREPSLLVLRDASPSMLTKDIQLNDQLKTRKEISEAFLAGEVWQEFEASTSMKIQEQVFAQDAKETDLSAILDEVKSLQPTAVLLVSDGAWNAGEAPSMIGQQYRKSQIALYSLAMGEEVKMPDLAIEVIEAPQLVEIDDPFILKVAVESTYPERTRTKLRVSQGEVLIEEREVTIEAGSEQVISFIHDFVEEGTKKVSVELLPLSDEVIIDNNYTTRNIVARAQEMKVLLVDTLPRWEYRFIRNAMIRDERVEVDCLLLHPDMEPGSGPSYLTSFPDSLADYDVVLLGDIGIAEGQLTEAQVDEIILSVRERATGVILLPGKKGWQQTLVDHPEFRKLYPVQFKEELGGNTEPHTSQLKLSSSGQQSLLMNLMPDPADNSRLWESLPGFNWYQPTASLKAGATALAYHENARNEEGTMPLVVTSRAGRGKVLFMGIDSSWRWRRGVEDLYHYRFWRQMARWMSYQRNLTEGQQARLFLDRDSARVGQTTTFSLQAMNPDGQPATASQIKVQATLPDQSKRLISVSQSTEWGEFSGKVLPEIDGELILEVLVDNQSVAKRTIQVAPLPSETVGEPADLESLRELAKLTGATAVPYDQRNTLIELLEKEARPEVRYQFLPLTHQWGWYVAVITLLFLSWVLARITGEV